MARYLVTGGAGFIGSAISRRLVGKGNEVVVLDNLDTGKTENIPSGVEFLNADLRSEDTFERLGDQKFDAVFHLGAQASGELSYREPLRDFDCNARATVMLLEWCKKNGTDRFFFASSRVVYAESDYPLDENSPTIPQSYYGAAKLAAEAYINLFYRIGGRPTVFRLFNVYGPRQNLENLSQGMASIYLVYIFKGETILVKGSLDRYRDFIYVDDVVDAFMAALRHPNESVGQTYNLGTGTKTTVRELIYFMIKEFGHDPDIYPVNVVGGTPGDVAGSTADISKAMRDLMWYPKVELMEGLRRTVDWAKGLRDGD